MGEVIGGDKGKGVMGEKEDRGGKGEKGKGGEGCLGG